MESKADANIVIGIHQVADLSLTAVFIETHSRIKFVRWFCALDNCVCEDVGAYL